MELVTLIIFDRKVQEQSFGSLREHIYLKGTIGHYNRISNIQNESMN